MNCLEISNFIHKSTFLRMIVLLKEINEWKLKYLVDQMTDLNWVEFSKKKLFTLNLVYRHSCNFF